MSLKSNILNAFKDNPINWVNFRDARRSIAPPSFAWLAHFISKGDVKVEVDSSIEGRTAFYDPDNNKIIGSSGDFGSSYWDEKSLLIHESVHAVLDGLYRGKDYKGIASPMTVLQDETFAYIAGGLYLYAGQGSFGAKDGPEREALKLAQSKANRSTPPAWDEPFEFTATELIPLQNAIKAHPFYKGKTSGIAKHDGF